MERQPEVARFFASVEKRVADGMTDMKFFVGDVSESTRENFCREANAIDTAMECGMFKEIDWKNNPTVYSE